MNGNTGKKSRLREFSVKDLQENRSRLTFWDSFKFLEALEVGQVLVITNVQTGTYPKNRKPKFLQTIFASSIKNAPQEAYDAFETISDKDARYCSI